jgi:hypothetical protein
VKILTRLNSLKAHILTRSKRVQHFERIYTRSRLLARFERVKMCAFNEFKCVRIFERITQADKR